MKYSLNPLRYVPIFADLYGFLDYLRFRKQLLIEKFDLYLDQDGGVLLIAKDKWAEKLLEVSNKQ